MANARTTLRVLQPTWIRLYAHICGLACAQGIMDQHEATEEIGRLVRDNSTVQHRTNDGEWLDVKARKRA